MSPSISVVELRDQVPGHAQLVDVRSASEYGSGHIPGAVNIQLDQIEARLDDLSPNAPLVLVCQTGKWARMMAALLEFEIRAQQHTIAYDQPAENGGYDEGMTPPELLLASLGSCAGFYAAQYLPKYKLVTEGTRVRVTADKVKDPARVDNFRIEIETRIELSEQHREGVERAVHHCLIHNTLMHPPKMSIAVKQADIALLRS